MQDNNLTGQLPSSYPLELPHLEDLQVQGNQLEGSVPATWQNWGSLKTVYAPCLVIAGSALLGDCGGCARLAQPPLQVSLRLLNVKAA